MAMTTHHQTLLLLLLIMSPLDGDAWQMRRTSGVGTLALCCALCRGLISNISNMVTLKAGGCRLGLLPHWAFARLEIEHKRERPTTGAETLAPFWRVHSDQHTEHNSRMKSHRMLPIGTLRGGQPPVRKNGAATSALS